MEDEMSWTRGTYGKVERFIIVLARNLREQLAYLSIDGGIILKWIINFY
jgi:hypothetical protein